MGFSFGLAGLCMIADFIRLLEIKSYVVAHYGLYSLSPFTNKNKNKNKSLSPFFTWAFAVFSG